MTTPRRKQICLDVTPYYHCVTRCVRRSFLCGTDHYTNKNFDHRRGWIEKQLLRLADAFCIEVAAYAIMSNHYHVILRVDVPLGQQLTDKEIIGRWLKIFKGNTLTKKYIDGQILTTEESAELNNLVHKWRSELTNISRFMGQINEKIARWANKEDDCKGRFWESRFDCKAILDTNALLQSMVYTDLNPVRAGLGVDPKQSLYTSLKRRLSQKNHGLIPFRPENPAHTDQLNNYLPITHKEYCSLIQWSTSLTNKSAENRSTPPPFKTDESES